MTSPQKPSLTSPTEPKKTWKRLPEITGQFPKNKYHFSTHLTRVGDWVETEVMNPKEVNNIMDAAHFWAWKHNLTVQVRTYPGEGGRHVRITLMKKHRERDYD